MLLSFCFATLVFETELPEMNKIKNLSTYLNSCQVGYKTEAGRPPYFGV